MHELVRIGIGVGLSIACGCGGGRAGVRGGGPDGPVRFALVQGTSLKLMEATAGGLRELRTVTLPMELRAVEWVRAEPVVMLDGDRAGEVGRITEKGYEPFPALPAATWTIKPEPEGFDHFETPDWKLVVTADGAIWQGRCEWGYFGDGDACTEFIYARLDPPAASGPVAPVREEPKSGRAVYELPKLPPSPTTQVALADLQRPATEDEPKPEPIKILRCTQGGQTIEYPPEDERYLGMSGEIRWLSTEPPIYTVDRWESGEGDYLRQVVFEGCAESAAFGTAALEPGPNGFFAIIGEKTSLRWRERELRVLEGGALIRFAARP